MATIAVLLLFRGVGGPPWWQQLVDLLVVSAPLVFAFAVAVRVAAARGFVRRVLLDWRATDLLLGVSVGLLLRAVVEVVAPTTGTLRAGFGDVSLAAVAVLAVGAALVTPVVEELFFRGLAVAALADVCAGLGRVAAGVIAVAVSSAAFVALHVLPGGAAITLGAVLVPLLVGVGCGILMLVTRRIAAAVIAHVVFNAIGVGLLLL